MRKYDRSCCITSLATDTAITAQGDKLPSYASDGSFKLLACFYLPRLVMSLQIPSVILGSYGTSFNQGSHPRLLYDNATQNFQHALC